MESIARQPAHVNTEGVGLLSRLALSSFLQGGDDDAGVSATWSGQGGERRLKVNRGHVFRVADHSMLDDDWEVWFNEDGTTRSRGRGRQATFSKLSQQTVRSKIRRTEWPEKTGVFLTLTYWGDVGASQWVRVHLKRLEAAWRRRYPDKPALVRRELQKRGE